MTDKPRVGPVLKFIGILLVIGVIGTAIMILSGPTASGPGSAQAEAFLEALRDGDYSGAYSLCTDEFQASTSLDEFENSLKRSAFRPESWKRIPVSKSLPDGAKSLLYTIRFANGTQDDFTFIVKPVGDMWAVNNFLRAP